MRTAALPKPPPPWPFFSDPDRACLDVADPSVFFPAPGGARVGQAREVCRPCPVKADCREWAIRYEAAGVWGGTTAEERGDVRRRRAGETDRACEVCQRTYTPRSEYQRACGQACASRLTTKGRHPSGLGDRTHAQIAATRETDL